MSSKRRSKEESLIVLLLFVFKQRHVEAGISAALGLGDKGHNRWGLASTTTTYCCHYYYYLHYSIILLFVGTASIQSWLSGRVSCQQCILDDRKENSGSLWVGVHQINDANLRSRVLIHLRTNHSL